MNRKSSNLLNDNTQIPSNVFVCKFWVILHVYGMVKLMTLSMRKSFIGKSANITNYDTDHGKYLPMDYEAP